MLCKASSNDIFVSIFRETRVLKRKKKKAFIMTLSAAFDITEWSNSYSAPDPSLA